jgi:uncharacterized protein YgiM (DUF1202 family)
MKRMFVTVVFFMVTIIFASAVHAQGEYYVQSVKAKVMSATSFKAAVMGEVAKGFKFVSADKEGTWVKVKYNNKVGYVSSLLVSTHPPFDKTGVIKGDESDIKQGVRRRASSYTSAAAARGLASDDRRRLSTQEKADYDSLEKMESFKLTSDEISRFMEGNTL